MSHQTLLALQPAHDRPIRSWGRARRFVTASVVTALAAGSLSVAMVAAGSPAQAATSCADLNPFMTAWVNSYMSSIGNPNLAAAVFDTSTGCSSRMGATDGFATASTVKAEIMGALFLSWQDQGLTSMQPDTEALVTAMIEESDNAATQALYDDLGGGYVLQDYGRRLGMQTTDNISYGWGGDVTTPDDQLRLLRTLLLGGGALNANWVAQARHFMGSVVPSEDWGVNTGVPTGSTVWLKNGWYFNDGSDWGPAPAWRVNSIGAVELPNGRSYLIAVYGNEWDTMEEGQADIGTISDRVASVLSAPRTSPAVVYHSLNPSVIAALSTAR